MKTSTSCIAGDSKSRQARRRRVKWYQAVRIAQEVQTLSECAAMLLYTLTVCLGNLYDWLGSNMQRYKAVTEKRDTIISRIFADD